MARVKKMKLVDDWRKVLHKAWVNRLSFVGILIGGSYYVWPALAGYIPMWAFIVGGFTLVILSRVIDQKDI